MNPLRYLSTACIDLAFRPDLPAPIDDETPEQEAKRWQHSTETVCTGIAAILDRSETIINLTKFTKDLILRENRTTTAVGHAVAIPHVRTAQARSFVMGYARTLAPQGIPFGTPSNGLVRHFFLLTSPCHEDRDYDRIYLRVYRQLAEMILEGSPLEAFDDAKDAQDIFNIFRGYVVQ
jgi:mannitol/fructose-specific phosphotransferase system IIA component (Ntr-type)